MIARKYNFFSENILQTVIPPGSDFVYSSGINGVVYKMSKQDIQRHLVKQKEKLKNKQVHKLVHLKAETGAESFKLIANFLAPVEDGAEGYLFDEGHNAITAMHLVGT